MKKKNMSEEKTEKSNFFNKINNTAVKFNTWIKVIGFVFMLVFSGTMIYYQINDNTTEITLLKKNFKEEITIIKSRSLKRYNRIIKSIDDNEAEVKNLEKIQTQIRIEVAYEKGLRIGKESN